MENMNINLWENNKDSKVLTPDPIATQNTIPIPKITPRFIQQGLGPNGTANTMITDIDNGFKVTKQVLVPISSSPIKLKQPFYLQ